MPVSFSKDIKPMFREVDINHMKVHGVHLDDYQYMSDATSTYANAQAVWWIKPCLLAAHSGPRSSSVCTSNGELTDISPDWSQERNSAHPPG